MNRDHTRSGGRTLHHSGNLNTRTSSVQIYAGTVPSKPIATPRATDQPKGRWAVVLIVGMVFAALVIVGVTLASLQSNRRKEAQRAAARTALARTRAATAALWTQQLEATYGDVTARAAAAALRAGTLAASVTRTPEPQRSPLVADAARLAARATSLTGSLVSCQTVATNLLAKSAVAPSQLDAENLQAKMGKVAESLKGYADYLPPFEASLTALERRLAETALSSPLPPPTPQAPATPTPTLAATPTDSSSPIAPPTALQASPSDPPQATPVAHSIEHRVTVTETYYVRALTNHSFAAAAQQATNTLNVIRRDGCSDELKERAQQVTEKIALLSELHGHVVDKLSKAPLPQGWILTDPPSDVLSASAQGVTLRSGTVAWSQVAPRQMLHLQQQFVPVMETAPPSKARALLAAALYATTHGHADAALRYRTEAIKLDAAAEAAANQFLPGLPELQRLAGMATVARAQATVADTERSARALMLDLVGDSGRGKVSATFFAPIPGNRVEDLRKSPKFPDKPDERETLTRLEFNRDRGEEFGALAQGLLLPPKTGLYRFFLCVDDAGEAWLGSGANPTSNARILKVDTASSRDNWKGKPEQQSEPVLLSSNRVYSLELLYKESKASDSCKLGWLLPGEKDIRTISEPHLATFPTNGSSDSVLAARATKSAWETLLQADELLLSAQATLGSVDPSSDPATMATAVRKALDTMRQAEAILAKARPLVQQVVQSRQGKRL